jgi:diadenosine tetraphosphate (Ap4A) HIT family hydrolase
MPRVHNPAPPARTVRQPETGSATGTNTVNTVDTTPARPDAFDRDEAIHVADLTPIFGTTRAPVPELLKDWRQATVQAKIQQDARWSIEPKVRAAVKSALAAAEQQLNPGEELTEEQIRRIKSKAARPILDAEMPGAIAHFASLYDDTPKSRAKAIADSVDECRPIVEGCRDPFTPIAQGDPTARANETVLWENKRFMILADRFCPGPKALVIPKQPALFPTDVPPSMLKEMAQLASIAGTAFMQLSSTPNNTVDYWINPPPHVSVKQLHVHVQPNLPSWDEQCTDPADVPSRTASVYGLISQKLTACLGPSIL